MLLNIVGIKIKILIGLRAIYVILRLKQMFLKIMSVKIKKFIGLKVKCIIEYFFNIKGVIIISIY